MPHVTLPVHKLSKAIVLHHYGCAEPISLISTDPCFHLLSARTVGAPTMILTDQYADQITLDLPDELLPVVNLDGLANRWFGFHRAQFYSQVAAVTRYAPRSAKATIDSMLTAYGLDAYAFDREVAYKQWQRFAKNFSRKNPHFLGRIAPPLSGALSQKNEAATAKTVEPLVVQALARYDAIYRRRYCTLEKALRLHIYIRVHGASIRQAACAVGVPRNTATSCLRTLRKRAHRQRALADILSTACDLPAAPLLN